MIILVERERMKINIMHISDLHRDPNNPISNEALINSLIQDVENSVSEDPPILPPQIEFGNGTNTDKYIRF